MARSRSYRMTPKRRAVLRKAQLASARKRRGTARRPTAKAARRKVIRRRVVTGVAVAAVVGGGAYGGYRHHDNKTNIRIYHNTDKRHAASIRANGLRGVKVNSFSNTVFKEPVGHVFVSAGRNRGLAKHFGNRVVVVKMNRKKFVQHAHVDYNMPGPRNRNGRLLLGKPLGPHSIHESHLKGAKVSVRRAGPIQSAIYGAHKRAASSPIGTKVRTDNPGFNKGRSATQGRRTRSKVRRV